MIFDTTSPWTILNTNTLTNAQLISNYDLQESETASVCYKDNSKTIEDDVSYNLGSVIFSGTSYKDKMCLYQTRNDRTDQSGRMCVRQQKFMAVDELEG
jgi:hypothetical protein